MSAESRRAMLVTMLEVYGIQASRTVLVGYEWALQGVSDEDLEMSIAHTMRTWSPARGFGAPRPADLLRLVGYRPVEERAALAWSALNLAADRVGGDGSIEIDDAIASEALRDIGGWVRFCEIGEKEEPFERRRFAELYRAREYSASLRSAHHAGRHELENRSRGLESFVPRAMLVECGPYVRYQFTLPPGTEAGQIEGTKDE